MVDVSLIAEVLNSNGLQQFSLGFYMALSLRQGRIAKLLDLMLPVDDDSSSAAQDGQQAAERSQQDRNQATRSVNKGGNQ